MSAPHPRRLPPSAAVPDSQRRRRSSHSRDRQRTSRHQDETSQDRQHTSSSRHRDETSRSRRGSSQPRPAQRQRPPSDIDNRHDYRGFKDYPKSSTMSSHDARALSPPPASEDLSRKRSLVRPERRRIDRDDPNYHYRKHAQNMSVHPSNTGDDPRFVDPAETETTSSESTQLKSLRHSDESPERIVVEKTRPPRRKSEPAERPKMQRKLTRKETQALAAEKERKRKEEEHQVPTLWNTYCHLVTFWCPNAILHCLGKASKPQQRAWREKMGLVSIILLICLFVGYLTFGFTATVCPQGGGTRLRINHIGDGYLIIHGQAYDLTRSSHPYALGVPAGANVLWDLTSGPIGGMDISFLFQNVNGNCKGLITPSENSDVPTNANGDMAWYFPCNPYDQDGMSKPNLTIPYYLGYSCHLSNTARRAYYNLQTSSAVYFTWDDVKNSTRNLAVYGNSVVDLNLLEWFNKSQVAWPARFDEIRTNPAVKGVDLTLAFTSPEDRQIGKCFTEIIKVGSIDTEEIGCIASKVVLYISLVFILSVVIIKFLLALAFQWFLSKQFAAATGSKVGSKDRRQEIEDWEDDIYRPPPKLEEPAMTVSDRSRLSSAFFPTTSRFTSPYALERTLGKNRPQPTTMASGANSSTTKFLGPSSYQASETSLPAYARESRTSLMGTEKTDMRMSSVMDTEASGPAGFVHGGVVPQPPPDWQPFGYPLAHVICLVTAYSEGETSIRTTLDSIATTDYPNSHKVILVVCDGLIKGKGEEFTTPEITLGMMKDYTILPDEVQPFSYVAVASGSKRHNMAKVYSGFYDYGEQSRVPAEHQQRVPMVVVVKCGTPDEARKPKPGNRGKRDSQIILMSFLQKVMFDERMTELEYEMFNGIWKLTGISPDYYETVLMVDADTKVFPDCLTHMMSAMVKDPEIMGLCGETKIANKRESWVSMIQVFEYFISHHLAKSFESVFGGVTCLPGCFSMYRIKAPKGAQNYWVPILANPDIVEHYSENVVDTLHKKNLLLLGEDRYLSTLMLKTFPKRKQVFVPQAVCKTTVPAEFKVLLSQRRRWINSTIHNLMELVLVRDLCGTFCFSMQFVVFIELVGTLVLPAAITFTVYLIIRSIVAAISHTEIPIIPLVLLALILGLPAVLIVLTAHRWSYVMWMFIYLLSLPIWNGVLPAYAYWKFDDFSWGETRKTAGETTKKAGLEYEGEFDSSKITMKRWGDFEQERRLRGAERWSNAQLLGQMQAHAEEREQRGSMNGGRHARDSSQPNMPPSAWGAGGGRGNSMGYV